MKKWMLALLCMAAASLVMSGCAANASGTTATAAPLTTNAPMATMKPATAEPTMAATIAPEATAGTQAAMTPAEAGRLAEKISDAVERISEVNDAEVVVSEKRVLVAVEFEDQYNAGLDERMKQTIIETVQKVDDSLTDIEVTDDDTLYGQVKGLAERVGKATGLDELADDFGDLWDRIIGR